MLILAIDTAGCTASAALVDRSRGLMLTLQSAETRASRRVLGLIDSLLEQGSSGFDRLDGIAVAAGPGSFTGLRVGLATANGLGFALGLPVRAVSSLRARVQDRAPAAGGWVVLLDASRGRFYAARFVSDGRVLRRSSADRLVTQRELEGLIEPGDRLTGELSSATPVPLPAPFLPLAGAAALGVALAAGEDPGDWPRGPAQPLYLSPAGGGVAAPDAAPPATIEPMSSADLLEVLNIERQSFAHPWSPEAFLGELARPRSACRVLRERGGRVVAYAVACHVAPELQVHNLAVAPGARRRGHGRALLEALLGEARERGAEEAWLEVRPGNHEARALYARLGFEESGRRSRYYADGEDALLLRRPLPRRQA